MPAAEIFTDGACAGNPGPGGWGAILRLDGAGEIEMNGGAKDTTANRMELTAAIMALIRVPIPHRLRIITDSQYLISGHAALARWRENGWRRRRGQPVKNRDLWRSLAALTRRHDVEWIWVKGHSGHCENERCDTLAKSAIPAK